MSDTGRKHLSPLAEGKNANTSKKGRGHSFALKCETCAGLFILRRPRRVLGWLPLPEGHGPGRPCEGSLRILHNTERRAALRARGSA
jgi:hypothetical protein